jgi:hypothetical protein
MMKICCRNFLENGFTTRKNLCSEQRQCERKYRSRFSASDFDARWSGRAGGGEEMGGLNGLHFFLQKTAIQGSPDVLTQLLKFISRVLRKNIR